MVTDLQPHLGVRPKHGIPNGIQSISSDDEMNYAGL